MREEKCPPLNKCCRASFLCHQQLGGLNDSIIESSHQMAPISLFSFKCSRFFFSSRDEEIKSYHVLGWQDFWWSQKEEKNRVGGKYCTWFAAINNSEITTREGNEARSMAKGFSFFLGQLGIKSRLVAPSSGKAGNYLLIWNVVV